MFSAARTSENCVALTGRFDAAQIGVARETLDRITSTCTIDFQNLEYISSAGLGTLVATQKRLAEKGCSLRFVNVSRHVGDVLRYAGFDRIFEISYQQ